MMFRTGKESVSKLTNFSSGDADYSVKSSDMLEIVQSQQHLNRRSKLLIIRDSTLLLFNVVGVL
jgi:hypothetical protein